MGQTFILYVQSTGRLETHAALLALFFFYTRAHAKHILQIHSAALHVMLTRPKSLHNPCLVINQCVCSCGHTEKQNQIKSRRKLMCMEWMYNSSNNLQ